MRVRLCKVYNAGRYLGLDLKACRGAASAFEDLKDILGTLLITLLQGELKPSSPVRIRLLCPAQDLCALAESLSQNAC